MPRSNALPGVSVHVLDGNNAVQYVRVGTVRAKYMAKNSGIGL